MAAILTFASDLAPQIYAGSDLFLMPSLFEPCGLGQLIAMRYGSVPVVRATGGLADTVRDGETGFTFDDFTADAFWMALQRALFVYNTDAEGWARLVRNGMSANFSWDGAARGYVELYDVGDRPEPGSRRMKAPIRLALIWHFHQPDYTDPQTGAPTMPWTRLHALKDYADMAGVPRAAPDGSRDLQRRADAPRPACRRWPPEAPVRIRFSPSR